MKPEQVIPAPGMQFGVSYPPPVPSRPLRDKNASRPLPPARVQPIFPPHRIGDAIWAARQNSTVL